MNFEIYSITDAGRNLEGTRGTLKAAFALARQVWREYRERAQVEVRWEGTVIASDPIEFTIRRRDG